jgi:hypothetical protein
MLLFDGKPRWIQPSCHRQTNLTGLTDGLGVVDNETTSASLFLDLIVGQWSAHATTRGGAASRMNSHGPKAALQLHRVVFKH